MHKNIFITYFITLIIFLVLDGIYLGLLGTAKNQYLPMNEEIQGSETQVRIYSAIIAYLIIALAVLVFVVLPNINRNDWVCHTIASGIIAGLAIYGTYNFTNHALLNDFTLGLAIQDTIWGTVVMSLTGLGTILTTHLLH